MTAEALAQLTAQHSHHGAPHTSSRDVSRGSPVFGMMKGLLVAWPLSLTPHVVFVGVVHLFDPAVAERQFPHPVNAAVHPRAQAQVGTGSGAVEAISREVVCAGTGRRQGERSVELQPAKGQQGGEMTKRNVETSGSIHTHRGQAVQN